jgi:hypothetical protein
LIWFALQPLVPKGLVKPTFGARAVQIIRPSDLHAGQIIASSRLLKNTG